MIKMAMVECHITLVQYDKKYKYWTMSSYDDSSKKVWFVSDDGSSYASTVYGLYGFDISVVVRPVVTILKSAI